MAIERVTASIARASTDLNNTQGDYYSGSLTAPRQSGNYGVEIVAYDDSGSVTTANSANTVGLNIAVSKWSEPKVNWTPTDRFNFVDYNRIKNNLECLHELAESLYKQFAIGDMGEDITTYSAYWDVDIFNLFERNLETINKNVLVQNFGQSQTFYPNGVFIQWDELNRIESAILALKETLDSQQAGKRRLSFRLGTFKEVKI